MSSLEIKYNCRNMVSYLKKKALIQVYYALVHSKLMYDTSMVSYLVNVHVQLLYNL